MEKYLSFFVIFLLLSLAANAQKITSDTTQVKVGSSICHYVKLKKGETIVQVENASNYLAKSEKKWCHDITFSEAKKTTLHAPCIAALFSVDRLKELAEEELTLSLKIDKQGNVMEVIYHFSKEMFHTLEELFHIEQAVKTAIKFPTNVHDDVEEPCEYVTCTAPITFSKLLAIK